MRAVNLLPPNAYTPKQRERVEVDADQPNAGAAADIDETGHELAMSEDE